jgi:catechol 1,2-dioxygenase
LKGVLIEVWQTDAKGEYHYQDENYRLRGQMRSDSEGRFSFNSVMPGRYGLMRGYRPAHIHFRFSHPEYRILITQLYFRGDPYLWPNDACGRACRSDDPLRIIELKKRKKGQRDVLYGYFKVVLQDIN